MQYRIGEAAKQTGCPASTIRYYEKIGLLRASVRGHNGYRYYDSTVIERLAFVHRARMLGFSIDATAQLLQLADHPDSPCDDVDRLVSNQLDDVRRRLRQLQTLESQLVRLQQACAGGHAIEHCGVLTALSSNA